MEKEFLFSARVSGLMGGCSSENEGEWRLAGGGLWLLLVLASRTVLGFARPCVDLDLLLGCSFILAAISMPIRWRDAARCSADPKLVPWLVEGVLYRVVNMISAVVLDVARFCVCEVPDL